MKIAGLIIIFILIQAACDSSAPAPTAKHGTAIGSSITFVQADSKSSPKNTLSGKPLVFASALSVENDVEVKTRLTGIIEKILVERGSRVKKGTPLAELQNDDLQLEIKKADAAKQEMQFEFERAKSLYDQKLLSESEYDAKRLGLEKASAELEIAKVNYEKSVIRAPFNGVVVERYLKIGQRVVEDENVALFRITAMEPLLARIFVPEEHLQSISAGARCQFVPNVAPDRSFRARVKWISSAVDPASGTASALIELLSSEGLRPGISGKIVFDGVNTSSN